LQAEVGKEGESRKGKSKNHKRRAGTTKHVRGKLYKLATQLTGRGIAKADYDEAQRRCFTARDLKQSSFLLVR
jgi:hypothetical protein